MRVTRVFEVLALLLSTRSSSKIIHAAITGNYSLHQINTTLNYLNRKGYVKRDGRTWEITDKGRAFYREKGGKRVFRYFQRNEVKGKEVNNEQLLILFDIPEKERRKRDWLRAQLKLFGYKQVQKSAWIGPSNLPKDFYTYLDELHIKDRVKIFKTHRAL